METNGFFWLSGLPLRLFKARGGEVLHDSYINIVLSLRDGGDNSFQILSPRWRREWWWGSLGWYTHISNNTIKNIWFIKQDFHVVKVGAETETLIHTTAPQIVLYPSEKQCPVKVNWNLTNSLWGKSCWRHYQLPPAGGDVYWCWCHTLEARAVAESCWVVPSPSRTERSSGGPLLDWSSCRWLLPVPSPKKGQLLGQC